MTTTLEVQSILTIEEAAEVLRVGRTTMYELVLSGQVPSFTVGRARRLRRSDLDDYIKRRVALQRAYQTVA